MGVALLTCITKNATIKARTTFSSSPPQLGLSPVSDVSSERLGGLLQYYSRAA
jgi:hypothetical protein